MSVYHRKTWIDRLILVVVVGVAALVMALSFGNTALVAGWLKAEPYLVAALVEVLFGVLLFLRGRQRATGRNVPDFVEWGYRVAFGLVTVVNMIGFVHSSGNAALGIGGGLAVSGGLWLMENTLVWWLTGSEAPRVESLREKKRKVQAQIKEEEELQRLEWRLWVARKPHPKLIKAARKEEETRKRVEAEGLPEFFLQQPELVEQVVAEPIVRSESSGVVPIRAIGFHAEMAGDQVSQGAEQPDRTPNTKTERAVRYVRELIGKGEQYSATTVAKAVGCGRTTAHGAIKQVESEMEAN